MLVFERIVGDRGWTCGPIYADQAITAGIDLALPLIEGDYGLGLAHAVARELVTYHRRPAGRSQFPGPC